MSCFFFRTLLKWKHKKIPIGQINYNKTKIITLSSVQSLIWSFVSPLRWKKNLKVLPTNVWNSFSHPTSETKMRFSFSLVLFLFFHLKKKKKKKENKNMSNDFFPIWPEVCHTQKNKQTEIPLLKNTNSSHSYCVDRLINTFLFCS